MQICHRQPYQLWWSEVRKIALVFLCVCLQTCAGAIPLIGCRGAAKADVRKHLTQQLTDKQLRVEKWQFCSNILCLNEEPAFLLVWWDSGLFSDACRGHEVATASSLLACVEENVYIWWHPDAVESAARSEGLGVPVSLWELGEQFVRGTTLPPDVRLINCRWIRWTWPWNQRTTEVCHFKRPVLFPGN